MTKTVFSLTKLLTVLCCLWLVSSCTTQSANKVTVVDLRSQLAIQRGYHVVKPGESVYFLAWRFNLDYRKLAAVNHLSAPYRLTVGQQLRLPSQHESVIVSSKPTATKSKHVAMQWLMPTNGKVVDGFNQYNQGINIAGKRGQAIVSTAAGKVVYAGHGLRGYGNLIIIKHDNAYLSAYAHNQRLLVALDQQVKAGQKIATMGDTDSNRVMLHFELRRQGKPVNPLKYINS